MDGNGRWAQRRALPRHAGHRAGAKAVRAMVEGCARRGIEALTVFAFSSENWGRPAEEVDRLMRLFVEAIEKEVDELHANGIRLRFIGDVPRLREGLPERIAAAEARTAGNTRMLFNVAVSYGGRWDIVEAARRLARRVSDGVLPAEAIDEDLFASELQLHGTPPPDLFIRTGGDHRISNFLLWDLAYTELHFCDTLWPDFGDRELDAALEVYRKRQRRFGLTGAQARAAHE
jgi:undecaprenyl diphosphate synthase